MQGNSKHLTYYICVLIFVTWNVWWMKQISSPRQITTWTGSKVVHWWRTHPGMMIQRQARTARGVMVQRRKVAYGYKLPSKKKLITWSRSMNSMSAAKSAEMKVMDCGESLGDK